VFLANPFILPLSNDWKGTWKYVPFIPHHKIFEGENLSEFKIKFVDDLIDVINYKLSLTFKKIKLLNSSWF